MRTNRSALDDLDGVIAKMFGNTIVSAINEYFLSHNISAEKTLFSKQEYSKELGMFLSKTLSVPFAQKLGLHISKIIINKRNCESDRPGWGISDLII